MVDCNPGVPVVDFYHRKTQDAISWKLGWHHKLHSEIVHGWQSETTPLKISGNTSEPNHHFRSSSGVYTRKINMEPENDGLEDDFPFQLGDF